jgi:hypothetical protein
MKLEDFAVEMRNLIVEPNVTWSAIEGPPGHPKARAFSGSNGRWQFLVMGAPPDERGRMLIGGTAVDLESGAIFILALEVAQLGFDCACTK